MDSTIVKVRCTSKKQINGYGEGANKQPTQHEIEFEVPYDQNSIFHKLSGGTNPTLRTINQEAAAMFEIGKDYALTLAPWVEESTE